MAQIVRTAFYNGIKSTIDPTIIPENSIWRALNVRSDISGILRTRKGSELVLPSMGIGKIQGMIEAFDSIVFIWNKRPYRWQNGNIIELSLNSVTQTSYDEVQMIKWTNSGQEMVYVFTGQGLYETNGNDFVEVTPRTPESGQDANMLGNEVGPQQAKFATLRASLSQRVAVSGIPGSPNTVYLSAPLDISYFPVSQIIQLPDNGDKITGITNWYNALLIFRENDIWAFFGTDLTDSSASLVLQDGSVGCIAPKTITHIPNLGVGFLGPDNIYAVQGVSGVENQSKAIPIGNDIVNSVKRAIEETNGEATGIYFDGEYRIAFPGAIQEQRVFRLSLEQSEGWYVDTGPPSEDYVIHDGELYGSYYGIGAIHRITNEVIYDDFNLQDTTTSKGIPVSITFRRENLQPGPARIKRIFLYVVALGRRQVAELTQFGPVFNEQVFGSESEEEAIIERGTEQNFNISIIVDGNEFKIDEVDIVAKRMNHQFTSKSEPLRIYEARIRPSLKGHFAQLKIEANKPGELIAILGYGIDFQQKGRIRGIREGVSNNKDW